MSVKLLIKRGTYNDIITKQLDVGELALTTDTRNLYVGTNLGNSFVGRCEIVSSLSLFNQPSKGQFIFDKSTNTLYLYDGSTYQPINNSNIVMLRNVGLIGNVVGIASMDQDGDVIIDTTLYNQSILSNDTANHITFTGPIESISNMTLNINTVYFFSFQCIKSCFYKRNRN